MVKDIINEISIDEQYIFFLFSREDKEETTNKKMIFFFCIIQSIKQKKNL
jgi:hypothetical protein